MPWVMTCPIVPPNVFSTGGSSSVSSHRSSQPFLRETARATVELITRLDAAIAGLAFVVELTFLEGRKKLSPHPVYSLVRY